MSQFADGRRLAGSVDADDHSHRQLTRLLQGKVLRLGDEGAQLFFKSVDELVVAVEAFTIHMLA